MAIKVDIPFESSVVCPCSLNESFAYLSDLEKAVPENFPGLEEFKQIEEGVFLWKFQELAFQSFRLKIVFATRLQPSPPQRIELVPVKGPYDSELKATWHLQEKGSSTQIKLKADFQIEAPGPGFLKPVLAPLAQSELSKLLERYLENVSKSLTK